MANYVDVDVRIIAEPTAILYMLIALGNTCAEEAKMGYPRVHLKALIDSRSPEVPEIDGLWLDDRSHIYSFEVCYPDTLCLCMEQPHNTNLGRLQRWVKTFDPEAKVYFITHYYEDEGYTTNDESVIREFPDFCYENIQE